MRLPPPRRRQSQATACRTTIRPLSKLERPPECSVSRRSTMTGDAQPPQHQALQDKTDTVPLQDARQRQTLPKPSGFPRHELSDTAIVHCVPSSPVSPYWPVDILVLGMDRLSKCASGRMISRLHHIGWRSVQPSPRRSSRVSTIGRPAMRTQTRSVISRSATCRVHRRASLSLTTVSINAVANSAAAYSTA